MEIDIQAKCRADAPREAGRCTAMRAASPPGVAFACVMAMAAFPLRIAARCQYAILADRAAPAVIHDAA